MSFKVIALIAFVIHLKCAQCLERELTIQINANARECFYEYIQPNHIIDFEYQVNMECC